MSSAVDRDFRNRISSDFYNRALREEYSEFLKSVGREEDARRALHFPVKPLRPVSLKTSDIGAYNKKQLLPGFDSLVVEISPLFNQAQIPEDIKTKYINPRIGKNYEIEASGVTISNDCLLSSNGGFVFENIHFAADNRLSREAYVKGIAYAPGMEWHYDLANLPAPTPGKFYIAQHHPMLNYYHFLIEQAPNLCLWKMQGDIKDYTIFLIENGFRKLFEQVLNLLDIDEKSYEFKKGSLFCFESCSRPQYSSNNSKQNKINFITAKTIAFAEFLRVESNDQERVKIYISRADANGKRGVVNDEEVCSLLEKRGYQIVKLDGMQLSEQVNLFSKASVVIGAHGAGLTNTMFCKPGTHVIELTNDFTCSRLEIFWDIASVFKLNFSAVVSESLHKDFSASFKVDIRRLEETLDLVEEGIK
ncbi:glycosyltransferase family 61 protein [Alteromonas macleodii]|uniref:glycosyltransferase family 61 protein n=1 Tax=Alteromonas macleodii TaxID=28108 RepID=UPI003CFBF6DF